jgi:hypothetical protein
LRAFDLQPRSHAHHARHARHTRRPPATRGPGTNRGLFVLQSQRRIVDTIRMSSSSKPALDIKAALAVLALPIACVAPVVRAPALVDRPPSDAASVELARGAAVWSVDGDESLGCDVPECGLMLEPGRRQLVVVPAGGPPVAGARPVDVTLARGHRYLVSVAGTFDATQSWWVRVFDQTTGSFAYYDRDEHCPHCEPLVSPAGGGSMRDAAGAAMNGDAMKDVEPSPLTGGFIGLDAGLLALQQSARRREGLGLGFAGNLRGGFTFWGALNVNLGVGVLIPSDERPFSEMVVSCSSVGGALVDCEDDPHSLDSTVGGGVLNVEAGYEVRISPWLYPDFVPQLYAGYQANIATLERSVSCSGCSDGDQLDVATSGLYVAPALRITLDSERLWAIGVRSQWFVTGDVKQMTLLGVEFGAR